MMISFVSGCCSMKSADCSSRLSFRLTEAMEKCRFSALSVPNILYMRSCSLEKSSSSARYNTVPLCAGKSHSGIPVLT